MKSKMNSFLSAVDGVLGCIYTASIDDQFRFCDYIRFFGRRAYISFKSDPYPMCAFYTALVVKQAKNSIYDITNQFE